MTETSSTTISKTCEASFRAKVAEDPLGQFYFTQPMTEGRGLCYTLYLLSREESTTNLSSSYLSLTSLSFSGVMPFVTSCLYLKHKKTSYLVYQGFTFILKTGCLFGQPVSIRLPDKKFWLPT